MGGVCTCARADESEPPEQGKRVAELVSATRVHTGDARRIVSERCHASAFAAASLEDLDSGEPPSSVGEVFHDAADEFTLTTDDATCGVSALASAPYAFARHAATWGVASEQREDCEGEGPSPPASRGGAVAEGVTDDGGDANDKPDEMRQMEKHAAAFDDSFWGGSGGGSGALTVLKQLFHLRNLDLSRFSGVPISQHLPVSSAEILHRYSFMPGRASPMQRLAAHMRLELPCVLAAPGLEGQLSRFTVVLRAHFALLDAPSQSLRKPFNPVLGEVSHHPPKTAFACYDPELRWDYIGYTDISPRFQGTYIRVPFTGHRTLTLHRVGEGGDEECYTATIPGMEWHLFPAVRAMYSGTWHLWCPQSGLAAEIIHPAARFMSGFTGQRRTRVHGKVTQVNAGSDPLDGLSDNARVRRAAGARTVLIFDGDFDGQITAHRPGEPSSERGSMVIWDVEREKGLEARIPATQLTPQLEPRSSSAVWGEVFAALHDKNWDAAARGKAAVEQAERRARKAREKQGIAWQSRWFQPSSRGDDWVPKP